MIWYVSSNKTHIIHQFNHQQQHPPGHSPWPMQFARKTLLGASAFRGLDYHPFAEPFGQKICKTTEKKDVLLNLRINAATIRGILITDISFLANFGVRKTTLQYRIHCQPKLISPLFQITENTGVSNLLLPKFLFFLNIFSCTFTASI